MINYNLLSGEVPSFVEDALAVLRAVFDTIPTFWGTSEVASIFRLYFDALALGSADEIGTFARRVAFKAPTATLLLTYFETWPSVSSARASVSRGRICSASRGSLSHLV
jgi:U3 small nucleolar RNA-associated protein 10